MLGKRLFDILVGTLLCLCLAPLVLVLALAVGLSLRTWRPFFVQDRLGHEGRTIRILKLRTLPVDFPPYALKPAVARARVPGFASFLRRNHLDELPQLLLVPFGHLSLVGPRPKMPDEFEPVDPVYGMVRIQVAQGCTGLWQIGRHSHQMPDSAPEYDSFYVEYASARLDAWVLWRTVLLVLRIRGPVSLAEIPRWACPQPRDTQVPQLAGERSI